MRISLKLWLRLRRNPWLRVFHENYRRWKRDNMQARSNDFPLVGPEDTVFDFGGFKGEWAATMNTRYRCRVEVFEPHPRFAHGLQARFDGNPAIQIHTFALGSAEGILTLSDDGDASSALKDAERLVQGKIVSVSDFMEGFAGSIAVAKINIEGGEYDLLPALTGCDAIKRIDCLQIQFHLFSETDIQRRAEIITALARTHICEWSYDFVWERWRRIA